MAAASSTSSVLSVRVNSTERAVLDAASLLLFALRTALVSSKTIGTMGAITHLLDDGVRAFYARWGFREMPFDPRRAMVVRMVDLRKSFVD